MTDFGKRCAATIGATLSVMLAASGVALAQPVIATDAALFVEQTGPGAVRTLEPAARLSPGDRVITVLTWHRLSQTGAFTITSPMPRAIAYQDSARDDQQLSVDGGRTWGRLEDLRVGSRSATPEDVTHVRWRIPGPIAARGRGQIAYSGVVR